MNVIGRHIRHNNIMKQSISIKNVIYKLALCSFLFVFVTLISSRVSASTIVNLSPSDDTKVSKSSPTTNYAKTTSLEVDGGGTYEEIYMKFDLSSLAGKSVVSAKLKIKVDNTSTSQQNYKLVSDTAWLETGINYNNRPSKASSAFATAMGGPSGSTQLIDMTSTVKSKLGQKFAFNIDMTTSDGFGFKSKETSTTSDRPVLIVEYNDTTTTATPTKTPTPTTSAAPTAQPTVIATPPTGDVISLSPIADTYVQSDTPSTNYGTKTILYSVGSPEKISYLKFDLSATAGKPIASAILYTKVQNDSTDVQTVSNVEDNAWIETAMNFSNKPALGTPIGTFTAGAINSMNTSDITSAVSAHTGGLMTIAFSSTKTNNVAVYSRESADKPVLKILFGPLETPPPNRTPTPVPTSSWHSVSWNTDTVSLKADNFYVVANGVTFVPGRGITPMVSVRSDQGNPGYTSLEVEWTDNGIPMRFYMYLKAEGGRWYVSEMRTYNGSTPGDWVTYTDPTTYFSTLIGQTYSTSDIDINADIPNNKVHFSHLFLSTTLTGTKISSNPSATPGNMCITRSKGDANCDGNVDFIDFEIWRNEFMGEDTKTDANFNYTEDQKVDFIDFEIWRQGYLEESAVSPTEGVTATPTPALSPSDTPIPTPTLITSCQWCGASCVPADINLGCPALAVPDGATCEAVAGECIATLP